ncbi:MAG: hydroxyacid dehydrogenase [Elusimicrobia bacterium]|nr:hydroxyacid dehydrogenase [Elusimicrobiota bacterium]
MRIAFFEVTSQEKEYLREQKWVKGATFFEEEIHKAPASAYRDAEVVSVFIYSKINRDVLKNAKKLRFIATRSTGYDHIDMAACRKRKIQVSNVPHYGENTVAEHTYAHILALSRKVHPAYVRTIRGDFSFTGLQGFDLKGKTLGVIGTGRIGMHVIRMAQGFGMRILAFDTTRNALIAEALGFNYVSLETLLGESDILTLHMPYLPTTHHFINEERIKGMKRGALLINTARGGLVDTNALTKALDSGQIGGAGLDVLEGEEIIKEERQVLSDNFPAEKMKTLLQNHILLFRENVVITPHIAFNSYEAFIRILETSLENIKAFAEGHPENVVVLKS